MSILTHLLVFYAGGFLMALMTVGSHRGVAHRVASALLWFTAPLWPLVRLP